MRVMRSPAACLLPAPVRPLASRVPRRASGQNLQVSSSWQEPACLPVPRVHLPACLQAEITRVDGRVTGLSEGTQPLLEAMHRTTAEQRTSFEDWMKILAASQTEALKPINDKLDALSGSFQKEISSFQKEISSLRGEVSNLKTSVNGQVQAIFVAAASAVTVLGLVANVAGSASSVPSGCYKFGIIIFFAFVLVFGAILARWLWLLVES